ncbi:MAG: exodeoxyribonuclease III [Bacteroidetes bacterium HGW-Bacteroidetes-3]|jgi:exodeoxyribonuclease-3|nr:MAG: exodeoxyribonuclease III [Bacteroidetes bacterium HGW-Bacteroidetes-3]
MHIISWNVNGIRATVKKDFIESVKKMNPDILCLQETKAENQDVENVLLPLSDYFIYSNSADRKGYSGTALLCKNKPLKIIDSENDVDQDKEGRIICAEYPNFYLVNVYAPNAGQLLERLDYKKNWNSRFLAYLKELEKTKPVIACGDFNVAHRPIDLKNDKTNYNKTAGYTQIEIDGMDAMLNSGFVDSFRYFHPNEVAYTYWSYRFNSRAKNVGWRIDYFLISERLINKVKFANIHSNFYGSDHCPISLKVDL